MLFCPLRPQVMKEAGMLAWIDHLASLTDKAQLKDQKRRVRERVLILLDLFEVMIQVCVAQY